MNSKKNIILRIVSAIDDGVIDRVSQARCEMMTKDKSGNSKGIRRSMAVIAASLSAIAVISAVLLILHISKPSSPPTPDTETESSSNIEQLPKEMTIERTRTVGNTDIYTITYTDGRKAIFSVVNKMRSTAFSGGLDLLSSSNEDVESIDNVILSEDGEFWLKMSDGKTVNIGSGVGEIENEENDPMNVKGVTVETTGELALNLISNKDIGLGHVNGYSGKNNKGDALSAAKINENGELIIGFSSGHVVNLGCVVGEKGDKGEDGIGIERIFNSDSGELVVLLTNGTEVNLGNIKGEDGIGISESKINDSGELCLTYTDGSSVNLGRVVGQDGTDGIGIDKIYTTYADELVVTLTNGTEINLGNIRGADGIGISESKINDNGELCLTYTDGSSVNLGRVVGEKGEDGVGIAGIMLEAGGELVITLTDGTVIDLGSIKGEDGKDGKSAYELYKEKYGYEGTEEEWLYDLVNGNLAAKVEYTVTFDSAGGTPVDAQIVLDGGKVTEPVGVTREGYSLLGWFIGEEQWSFVGDAVTEHMTLTARWEKVTYNVTYDLGEGVNDESNPLTYNVDEGFTLADPHRVMYVFSGWTYGDVTEPQMSVTILVGTVGDIVFTAHWTLIDTMDDPSMPCNGTVYRDYTGANGANYDDTMQTNTAHMGIDLEVEEIAPVYSIGYGVIENIWQDVKLGWCIKIKHPGGENYSIYSNLANEFPEDIKIGSEIYQGQMIGIVGETAIAELGVPVPHLHFELVIDGEHVDPAEYLPIE